MYDLLIKNGNVIDGTGSKARRADVGLIGDRIAFVGSANGELARQQFDAEGLAVAPGFVDVHTHLDAQLYWDPMGSPTLLHGTTTVFGGNCGYSLAPISAQNKEYLARLMAKVEGMPLESLLAGVPWKWESFEDYLNCLDAAPRSLNAGFLVGHSAIRVQVMGPKAVGSKATPDEVEQMARIVREAVKVGAFGFSSSTQPGHLDGGGQHVPSFWADFSELVALCAAVKESSAPAIEFIPTVGMFTDNQIELMTQMALAADRPLNWNLLTVDTSSPEIMENQLSASQFARSRGARIVALTLPAPTPLLRSFFYGHGLGALPGGWGQLWAKPVDERIKRLRDPAVRRQLETGAATPGVDPLGTRTNWPGLTILEVVAPENEQFVGRSIGDIARDSGKTPFNCLFDILVSDGLRTVFTTSRAGDDEDSWRARPAIWTNPDVVIGGSDAGAHLDSMCGATYTTRMLGDAVRERRLVSLEQAVKLMTDVPARLYKLESRGRIAPGYFGDMVVFDPETVGPGLLESRDDLPAHQKRLYAEPSGIGAVFVNGQQVVRGTEYTGVLPGRVLRSNKHCYAG
jgi:N-acyl-D-aspartate/D-glutamate deacylase